MSPRSAFFLEIIKIVAVGRAGGPARAKLKAKRLERADPQYPTHFPNGWTRPLGFLFPYSLVS